MTRAPDILTAALGHMQDRAATYDKPEGERSMPATVAAFNALTGHNLTAEQGWLFMTVLKLCRTQQGGHRPDNYEDGAAYFALMGEQAACDRKAPVVAEKPFLVCAGCANGHGPHAPGCPKAGLVEIPKVLGQKCLACGKPEGHGGLQCPKMSPLAVVSVPAGTWVNWDGSGSRPVAATSIVDVKLRSGKQCSGVFACDYPWRYFHGTNGDDIVAYRLA